VSYLLESQRMVRRIPGNSMNLSPQPAPTRRHARQHGPHIETCKEYKEAGQITLTTMLTKISEGQVELYVA